MAEVTLNIGGRSYAIACRDGGEEHLRALATRVDAKVEEARSAVGTANEVRQLLFAALLLADDLDQVPTASPTTVPSDPQDAISSPAMASLLNDLAMRVEAIADTLEGSRRTS